jgi:hypothetical protein
MVLAGDPLELRFKMTVGTAQAGGTQPGPRPVVGARLRSRTSRNSFALPCRRFGEAPVRTGAHAADQRCSKLRREPLVMLTHRRSHFTLS